MQRVAIANPSDGGLVYWLFKLYTFAACAGLAALGFVGLGVYLHFCKELPPIPDLATYASTAPGMTTLWGQDGTLLAELSTERREIVPLDHVPQTARRRLLVDRRSPLLLARRLRRARPSARVRRQPEAPAGSGRAARPSRSRWPRRSSPSERTWSRKVKELIFARRLEAKYSKREILSLYLNHIFLGNGAYGVQAAARKYFDKDVAELDMGQQALIAGLAQAPSRYSPFVDEDAAYKRRGEVLDNMVENGALEPRRSGQMESGAAAREGAARLLQGGHALFHGAGAARSGQAARAEGGSTRAATASRPRCCPTSTCSPRTTSITRRASSTSARVGAAPRRASTTPRRRSSASAPLALYGKGPLVEGKLYLGLVEKVTAQGAAVRVGGKLYLLPLSKHDLGGAVLRGGRDQRQADHRGDRGAQEARRRMGALGLALAHSALLRLHLRRAGRGDLGARAARAEEAAQDAGAAARADAARAGLRSTRSTIATATCWRWPAATTSIAPSSIA